MSNLVVSLYANNRTAFTQIRKKASTNKAFLPVLREIMSILKEENIIVLT